MKRVLTAVLVALSMLAPLMAQQNNNRPQQDDGQAQRRKMPFALWKAELPGGSYLVARNAISAVSTQQYVLDGVARVTEVNVTTNGNFHPRFYFLEMIDVNAPINAPGAQTATDLAIAAGKEAVDQVVPDSATKVVKNYPATTHAGTIEFRMPSAASVQKLYESVTRVWLTGESEVYTLKGTHRINPDKEIKPANDTKEDEDGPGTNSGGTE
ncbi:MAG: hypothetical protein ACREKL_08275 [Chthoniobacterales bacterium]